MAFQGLEWGLAWKISPPDILVSGMFENCDSMTVWASVLWLQTYPSDGTAVLLWMLAVKGLGFCLQVLWPCSFLRQITLSIAIYHPLFPYLDLFLSPSAQAMDFHLWNQLSPLFRRCPYPLIPEYFPECVLGAKDISIKWLLFSQGLWSIVECGRDTYTNPI